MKQKIFLSSLVIIAILINVAGIISENFLMRKSGEVLFFIPIIYYYSRKTKFNFNFLMFIILALAATAASCINNIWYFEHIKVGFWLGSYIFLIREAIKFTAYEKGSKFTNFYFVAVIALYIYLLSIHIIELENNINSDFTFSLYVIYYLNILLFAIAALVYYLNSFSKKSVYFICLTLSFIFADVLRDMEVFYFRDLSVEIVGTLIKFAALKMVFLFFVTPEKKLRLLHLV